MIRNCISCRSDQTAVSSRNVLGFLPTTKIIKEESSGPLEKNLFHGKYYSLSLCAPWHVISLLSKVIVREVFMMRWTVLTLHWHWIHTVRGSFHSPGDFFVWIVLVVEYSNSDNLFIIWTYLSTYIRMTTYSFPYIHNYKLCCVMIWREAEN